MSEIWGIPSPYKLRAPKPPYSTRLQLNGNFNGLYLRNGTRYKQSGKCIGNQKGSPISSQNDMNFDPQMPSNRTAIFTPGKFCILIHCQASQTGDQSPNRTQPNFVKRWKVYRANNPP